jgi:hypothetical protein
LASTKSTEIHGEAIHISFRNPPTRAVDQAIASSRAFAYERTDPLWQSFPLSVNNTNQSKPQFPRNALTRQESPEALSFSQKRSPFSLRQDLEPPESA